MTAEVVRTIGEIPHCKTDGASAMKLIGLAIRPRGDLMLGHTREDRMARPRRQSAVMALGAAVASLAVLGIGTAHATDPVVKCQEAKLKAEGKLQACLKKNSAKVLGGGIDAAATCQSKFSAARAKAGTACRYLDNGDGKVSDLDTGLQWEQKDNSDG